MALRRGRVAERPGISEVTEIMYSVSVPATGPVAPGLGTAGCAAARANSNVSPTGRMQPNRGIAVNEERHRVTAAAAAVAIVKSARMMSSVKESCILVRLRSVSPAASLITMEFQSMGD